MQNFQQQPLLPPQLLLQQEQLQHEQTFRPQSSTIISTPSDKDYVLNIVCDEASDKLAVVSSAKEIKLYSLSTMAFLGNLGRVNIASNKSQSALSSIRIVPGTCFMNDSNSILLGYSNGEVQTWDIRTFSCANSISVKTRKGREMNCFSTNGDNSRLVVGTGPDVSQ